MAGRVIGGNKKAEDERGLVVEASHDFFRIGDYRIDKDLIRRVELVTETNRKKISSALGWGISGGILFGPLGGIAGLVFGGRRKEVCFALYLKDGCNYLIVSDPTTYMLIKGMRL